MTAHAERRELAFTYHMRWAFGCASLSLALLMVALHRRGATRRSLLLAAIPILFGYYVLMFLGRAYAIAGGELPALAGAWMPNVIVMLTAMAISTLGTRRQVVA